VDDCVFAVGNDNVFWVDGEFEVPFGSGVRGEPNVLSSSVELDRFVSEGAGLSLGRPEWTADRQARAGSRYPGPPVQPAVSVNYPGQQVVHRHFLWKVLNQVVMAWVQTIHGHLSYLSPTFSGRHE